MRSHAESLERLGVARVDILLCHDIGRLTHGDAHAARVARVPRRRLPRDARAARRRRRARHRPRRQRVGSVRRTAAALRSRLHPARRPLHAARAARARRAAAAVRAARRVHHLRRAVQLRDSRRGLARRRRRSLQLRARRPPRCSSACAGSKQLCAEFSVPLQAAALQFPLGHPCVASVVAGCANGAEARNCAAMFAHPIPPAFWRALRERGLVDARAPLPA